MLPDELNWHLVYCKPQKERLVAKRLSDALVDSFLPLIQTRMRKWGRTAESIVPMFPGYVFARFAMGRASYRVNNTPGVRGLVWIGGQPASVHEAVIQRLQERCPGGVARVEPPEFAGGQSVRIADGPFSGFDAVFERYLSARDRVAILLKTVTESRGHVRLVLSSQAIENL